MVEYFVNGGPFMWPILFAFLFGIAFSLERFYSLIMSSVNSKKFFSSVESTLEEEGIDAAIELCEKTRGPVAEIFHAGLSRYNRGLDEVEKAIQNAGGIEMSFLEKNMIWLNAVITIAPLLGFTGTVSGMISAFEDIAAAND
ncbi:MAG: MotA/TolQ/ExbB proton channel family protein, partial [Fidelibacterota bacterium]